MPFWADFSAPRCRRTTASDQVDFLTVPDQGFRLVSSLQAAAAAQNVHRRGPGHQGGHQGGRAHPGAPFWPRNSPKAAPERLISFREKQMQNIAYLNILRSDSSRPQRYLSNGVRIIFRSFRTSSGHMGSNRHGGTKDSVCYHLTIYPFQPPDPIYRVCAGGGQ